jgi:leucyl-tRNA synthetase
VAEEWWERTGHVYSIHQQPFPTWDEELAAGGMITLVLQVNGRVRDRVVVASGVTEEDATWYAYHSPRVQSHIDGKTVRNVVYVPGRLVNVVVG